MKNIIEELNLNEISGVTAPAQKAAKVTILKRAQTGEGGQTVEEKILKFVNLESQLKDAERDGSISKMNFSKADAENALDELAQVLQVHDQNLSPETAFAKGMEKCPFLAGVALGTTTWHGG